MLEWTLCAAWPVVAGEGVPMPGGGPGEGQEALAKLISDAMTSWWAQAVAIAMYAAIVLLLFRSLRPGPLVFVEYVILFTALAYLIIRTMAPAVLGGGAAVMWAVSPRRRREMREAESAREAARDRGAALERTLDEALGDARDAPA